MDIGRTFLSAARIALGLEFRRTWMSMASRLNANAVRDVDTCGARKNSMSRKRKCSQPWCNVDSGSNASCSYSGTGGCGVEMDITNDEQKAKAINAELAMLKAELDAERKLSDWLAFALIGNVSHEEKEEAKQFYIECRMRRVAH